MKTKFSRRGTTSVIGDESSLWLNVSADIIFATFRANVCWFGGFLEDVEQAGGGE